MKINIKENASDLVRTADRTGLMADSFKDIAMRTRDDLVEIFGQDDSSYDYAPEVIETSITDTGSYAVRASADIVHHAKGTSHPNLGKSDEYIHQNSADIRAADGISAESDELIQRQAKEYGLNRIEKNRQGRNLADREAALETAEGRNNVFDRNTVRFQPPTRNFLDKTRADSGIRRETLIRQQQKEYAINKLKTQRSGSTRVIGLSRSSSKPTRSKAADITGRVMKRIAEDAKALLTTYSAAGAILLMVLVITLLFSATFMTVGDEDGNNFAYDFYEIGPGDTAIVKVAQVQLGNVGGNKFWKWYGFSSHVHWCACFVSWCGDQCGYIKAGIMPKFAVVGNGANWFKERHRWASRGYSPKPGDVVFFDWEHDGVLDHVGLVESCDGKTVTTIEGNSGNACKRQSYVRGSSRIAGYGIPAFNLSPAKDTDTRNKKRKQ